MLNVRVDASLNAQLPECSLEDIRQEAVARALRPEAELKLVGEVEAFLDRVERLGFMANPLHVNGATIDLRIVMIHSPASPSGPVAVPVIDEIPSERINREAAEQGAMDPPQTIQVGAPVAGPAETDQGGRDSRERPAPHDDLAPADVGAPDVPQDGWAAALAPADSAPAPEPARVAKAVEWTAAEDDLLVREVSARMARGIARAAAAAEVAGLLPGRTAAAVKYRCDTKLRDRLRGVAVNAPQEAQTNAAPAPDPQPEALPPAPVPESPAPAVEPLPRWQRDLSDRIDRMNARRPWAVADDLRLISAKSEGVGTARLAEEFGLSVRVVEERFHLLMPVKGPVEFGRVLQELRRRAAMEDRAVLEDGVSA